MNPHQLVNGSQNSEQKTTGEPPVRSSDMVSRHAMIVKDGYEVPLIGIKPDAVLESCDLCGNQYGMAELTWSGKQMLCKKCAS